MPKVTTINGFRYRGIKRYEDSRGKVRYYFRATGAALPDPSHGFREFQRAYLEAAEAPHKSGAKAAAAMPPLKRVLKSAPHLLPLLLLSTLIGPKQHAGVYLLFYKGALTYIGQSANMQKRIKEHASNGRPFDRAYFIKTLAKERFAVEAALIAALQPTQNRSVGHRFASVDAPAAEPTI